MFSSDVTLATTEWMVMQKGWSLLHGKENMGSHKLTRQVGATPGSWSTFKLIASAFGHYTTQGVTHSNGSEDSSLMFLLQG